MKELYRYNRAGKLIQQPEMAKPQVQSPTSQKEYKNNLKQYESYIKSLKSYYTLHTEWGDGDLELDVDFELRDDNYIAGEKQYTVIIAVPIAQVDKQQSTYKSHYRSEVIYKSDKNFIVRLKAMVDRAINEAGYKLPTKFFEQFDNAENYLFESREQTPDNPTEDEQVEGEKQSITILDGGEDYTNTIFDTLICCYRRRFTKDEKNKIMKFVNSLFNNAVTTPNSPPVVKELPVEGEDKAINILKELCKLKHYKDTVGKDSLYEKRQPELWKLANDFLNKVSVSSTQPATEAKEDGAMVEAVAYDWILFEKHRPDDLEIVAIIDENGEKDFGVYQKRWDWVSSVNERTLRPKYWCMLPPHPTIK